MKNKLKSNFRRKKQNYYKVREKTQSKNHIAAYKNHSKSSRDKEKINNNGGIKNMKENIENTDKTQQTELN